MILEAILTLGILGLAFGIFLAYASKKFAVKLDPRESEVSEALPGLNCGVCGQASCNAFAHALIIGDVPVTGCVVGGKETSDKLGKIMGVEAEAGERKVAKVFCDASIKDTEPRFKYKGVETCNAASLIAGGGKPCFYGCLGRGSCAKVCPVDAIKMVRDLPVIDEKKCIACGLCVKECPKNIIHLVPVSKKVNVLCSSKDSGKQVVVKCKVGCTGCGICEKACPYDAIHIVDNVAVIDYDKCKVCGICAQKCPRRIIEDRRGLEKFPNPAKNRNIK